MAELVTGFAGTPHISSDEVGRLLAGAIGKECYVFDTGSQLVATMEDANTMSIASGDALMYGRHVTVPTVEQINITSGTQGMNRNDIVGFRYTKDSGTGVESVALYVYEGTPTSGTATDPDYPTDSILDGVSVAFMPLYRVVLSGISAGTPTPIFAQIPSMEAAESDTGWIPLTSTSGTVMCRKVGKTVFVRGMQLNANHTIQWNNPVAQLPAEYRPAYYVYGAGITGGGGKYHLAVQIQTGGNIRLSTQQTTSGNGYFDISFPVG